MNNENGSLDKRVSYIIVWIRFDLLRILIICFFQEKRAFERRISELEEEVKVCIHLFVIFSKLLNFLCFFF